MSFRKSEMRIVLAFAVGAIVLTFYHDHPEDTWFVIKAVCCGVVVLWFFKEK
jgi:hypothetical protein